MRTSLLTFALILFLSIRESQSFGGGAPANPTVCSSMTPEHHTNPQTSPCPYIIEVEKTEVIGGQPLQIRLRSADRRTPFKGFLVMGQKYTDAVNSADIPEGKLEFSASKESRSIAKLVRCGGKPDSSMTHKNSQNKNEVTFLWTPPNEDGDYLIV
jgi:hypothetical protein